MNATMTNRLRKGFTLVELLIVIIIIAVLAAIAIPKFVNSGLRSKEAAMKSDLKLIRNAIELFRNDTSYYPKTLSDLSVSTAPTSGYDATATRKSITATDFKGPYLATIPNDAVSGSAFTYSTTSGSVGTVTCSATGTATDGTTYSAW